MSAPNSTTHAVRSKRGCWYGRGYLFPAQQLRCPQWANMDITCVVR